METPTASNANTNASSTPNIKTVCPKCNGTKRIKKADGTISICFDCLRRGDMDQHDKKVKSQSELGIKLY